MDGKEAMCYSAKRASSERSCFFFVVGGVGASWGGEGRLGIISAALARSSRNLSNSETTKKGEEKRFIRSLQSGVTTKQ